MYSFPYLDAVCCSMSSSNCCFLTCIQVSQEAGQVVWYSHLFKNFPEFVVVYTVKGFGIVNKAEIDVFLELSCFFDDPTVVGNLISGSSALFKTSLNIWKFMVHILLKPGLENFEDYFTSMWDECNCAEVWAIFGIAFLWDWKRPYLDFTIFFNRHSLSMVLWDFITREDSCNHHHTHNIELFLPKEETSLCYPLRATTAHQLELFDITYYYNFVIIYIKC